MAKRENDGASAVGIRDELDAALARVAELEELEVAWSHKEKQLNQQRDVAEHVLSKVRTALKCADGESLVAVARRASATQGELQVVKEILCCASSENIVEVAGNIAPKLQRYRTMEADAMTANGERDRTLADRDRWRRRARTQYALARWKALDASAAERFRSMRILDRAVDGYQNMVNAMGGNAVTFACPACGLVWTAAKEVPSARGGWRLCDSCLETEPDPWAKSDAEIQTSNHTVPRSGGENR